MSWRGRVNSPLLFSLLAILSEVAAEADPVQVVLSFEQTLQVGMPVWVRLDLKESTTSNYVPINVHYPFNDQPWLFGFSNKFEIEKEGKPVSELGSFVAMVNWVGPAGYLGLPTSPLGRIPLHLRYSFSEPGKYRMRYTSIDHGSLDPKGVLAASAWTDFELKPADDAYRSEWLREKLANPPQNRELLLGEYLPSLLACPDNRTLPLILEYCYASDRLVQGYAVYSLFYFDDVLQRTEISSLIKKRGTSDLLAYYLSWRRDLFQPAAGNTVDSLIPFLQSDSAEQVGGALRSLGFMHGELKNERAVCEKIGSAIMKAAPHIMSFHDSQVLQPFATFLGSLRSEESKELLWKLVNTSVQEQAMICIAWHRDLRDLPVLGESVLWRDVRWSSSIPYHLHKSYGTNAIPYLRKGVEESGFTSTAYHCAQFLALDNCSEGFLFFRDAIAKHTDFRFQARSFVCTQFHLKQDVADRELLDFLDTKIRSADCSGEHDRSQE